VFVYRWDVIFRCGMKKHIASFLVSGTASLRYPITSITPRPNTSKSNLSHDSGASTTGILWLQLDFDASHQPTIWHVHTPNVVPITVAKLDSSTPKSH
jgi:hypothetical protein